MNIENPNPADAEVIPHGSFADEIDEDAILAQAAAILSKRNEPAPAPEPAPPTSIEGPTLVHVLAPSVFLGESGRRDRFGAIPREAKRGEEVFVTPEQLTVEIMTNRDGSNSFDRMLARGDVGLGPLPAWVRPWRYGDGSWKHARAEATAKAKALPDAEERHGALEAIVAHFGPDEHSMTPAGAEKYYARIAALKVEHERKTRSRR